LQILVSPYSEQDYEDDSLLAKCLPEEPARGQKTHSGSLFNHTGTRWPHEP